MTEMDRPGVPVLPPVIYIVALAVGWFIGRESPFRLPAGTEHTFGVVGWILIAASVLLGGSAVALFRRAGTSPNPMRPSTAVVSHGPFRFTRNPMYVAFIGICVGISWITNNLWIAILMGPAAVLTRRLIIDREESYLARKFGEEYRAYTSRVRRWL